MTTRTSTRLRDRSVNPSHRVADSGPCKGHACDDCSTCRGGTCCGTVRQPQVKIDRAGNPALSPKPYTL
jgi:hypothetical protein